MDRRLFLSLLPALSAAAQQTKPATGPRAVAAIPLPSPFTGQTATIVELNFPPGAPSGPAHHHPGFVLGYVIEGEFRFQVAGEPERILRAGESFYEPPGAHHLTGMSASSTTGARVLAIVVAETGKPLTV